MARVVSWRGCAKFSILPAIPCAFYFPSNSGVRDKEDHSLLCSRSGRMSCKDRGGEHCVASARAAANETRKMITVPRIYECLLQRTKFSLELQLYLCAEATLGTEETGHCREDEAKVNVWTVRKKKKMACLERWPLVEVRLYIESFLRATFICISLQVFIGNSDRNTIKGNVFDPPMKARYVRIYPTAWVNHISLRAEFYGLLLRKCY